jgi:hypothetical protein
VKLANGVARKPRTSCVSGVRIEVFEVTVGHVTKDEAIGRADEE